MILGLDDSFSTCVVGWGNGGHYIRTLRDQRGGQSRTGLGGTSISPICVIPGLDDSFPHMFFGWGMGGGALHTYVT